MEDKETKLKPYADITVVVGKYVKDGKTRNRYQKIGTLFATPHFSHITIKLDSLPLGGEGWLSVFKREDFDKPANTEVTDKEMDEPVNLDNIQF